MLASIFLRFLNWEASLSRNNPTRITTEMEKVGYFLTSSFDFLPGQSFSLFEAKN